MRRLTISTQPISMTRSPSFGFSPVVSVSRTICLTRYPPVSESVGSLVFRVSGVPFHPEPLDFMLLGKFVQLPPEILVLDRLLVGGAPAAALPAVNPLGDALLHVLRIGEKPYPAGALERLERADHRGKLHAVVGGRRLAAPQLLFHALGPQQRAPAARTRVSAAGAVAEDLHRLLTHSACAISAGSATARGAAPAPGATWA